ncbi:MAG: SurA N-terminal domain-containing protein [Candidatus Omnitrophota bacterium]
MLKALRKKETVKRIFFVLALIIIPAFIFWGAGGASRSRSKGVNYAGKIFGRKVSYMEYQESLNAVKNQVIMQFGDNFYKIQKYLDFYGQAWDRLILVEEADRRKIKITNDELVNQIRKFAFFEKDGKFNSKLYETTLEYVFRTQARDFEEQIRSSLSVAKLFEEITKDVLVSEEDLINAYKKALEKVKVSFLRFSKSDLKDNAKAEAENALAKINEALSKKPKAKFQDIAKDLGLKAQQTPLLGRSEEYIPEIGASKEFTTIAFSLKPGEISSVVSLNNDFYILRQDELVPADMEKLNRDKEGIRQKLLEIRKEEKFNEFFARLKKSANLEDHVKRPAESATK